MKRNISNTILTKDYIFSKVSQITIFSTYTGISVEDIQHCIDTGEFISSPFVKILILVLVLDMIIGINLKEEILLDIGGEIVVLNILLEQGKGRMDILR